MNRVLDCNQAETFVHAYVDGELTGPDRDSYERHLEACARCAAAGRFQGRFKAAVRAHLPRRPLPASLERRIQSALADLPVAPGRRPWSRSARRWAPALAVAAAASVAGLYAGGIWKHQSSVVWRQALRTYQAEVPLDIQGADCRSVTSWFRGRVDFPVHAPQLRGQLTCQGGRLVNVEDQPAAYLVYQAPGGHRVSVLVFDHQAAPIEAPDRRLVNGREIFYRSGPGISTAAYHDRGLGYLFTSDLDQESLTQLVSGTPLH